MAFKPISLKNVLLRLGDEATGTDFAIQLTSVTLTPDVATERLKTLKPAGRYSSVDDPEWSLDLGYAYGYDDAGAAALALSSYLLENNGEQVPFSFEPIAALVGAPKYDGTVSLVAGALGGDQGAFSTQSVSLPVEGQPTVSTVTAPAG